MSVPFQNTPWGVLGVLTSLRMASTGLKPEKNPTLSTPVNSYGIHGYLYSARTTEWFVGKNENSGWDQLETLSHLGFDKCHGG